jgi:hypothetical protein
MWGHLGAQKAPGTRNAQVANRRVKEKYHFGDRRPNPDFENIWGRLAAQKAPEGTPGARNAQVANRSAIEKYHFGDRRPNPDFLNSLPSGITCRVVCENT